MKTFNRFTFVAWLVLGSWNAVGAGTPAAARFEDRFSKFSIGMESPNIQGVLDGLKMGTELLRLMNERKQSFASYEELLVAHDALREAVAIVSVEQQRSSELIEAVVAYSAELGLTNPGSILVGQVLIAPKSPLALGILPAIKRMPEGERKKLLLRAIHFAEREAIQGNG